MENTKLTVARKYCKANNLKYMIKNDALYVYVPSYRRYVQICYNLLNFADEASIETHIARQMFKYGIQ